MRIELLSRLQFVRSFHQAALDYSRTPWVQSAGAFGSITFQSNQIPLLVLSRGNDFQVVAHTKNGWKALSDLTSPKGLDPHQVRNSLQEALNIQSSESREWKTTRSA